jgi:arsenate reductase
MTEAYLRKLAGDRLRVWSAGTEPADEIHPMVYRVMAEVDMDLEGHRPKSYRDFLGKLPVYYLIIVCDGAARACPAVWPGVMERIVWPLEDPVACDGSHDQRLEKFREVRDEIAARVREWVRDLAPEKAEPAVRAVPGTSEDG